MALTGDQSYIQQSYITHFSAKFPPKMVRIWHPQRMFFLIANLLLLVACTTSNQKEFSDNFELSSFLKKHIHALPGQMVQFQILDAGGEPIPYDVLRFEWIEGGRIDFQTDQDGTLRMQFEKDMLENQVRVSAKSEGAKIKVIW